MKATVTVTFKDGILDPQGKAVLASLHTLGYGKVKGVRVGKLIELELDGADAESTRAEIEKACRELLANPVTENFTIRVG